MSDMHTKQEAPIRAWLSYYTDGAMTGAWQNFPTARGDLEENLSGVGVPPDKITDMLDTVCVTSISKLELRLPRQPDLDELNYLAARIVGMDESERLTFEAAVEAGEQCGSLKELINLAHNLDALDLYPGSFSANEFGGIMAEMHANEHTEVLERLRGSDDPQEKEFAAYVERLESNLDLQKYGAHASREDNGILTANGYLLLPDEPIPEQYTGTEDIPAEHRVIEVPAPTRRPSLLGQLAVLKEEGRATGDARADTPEKKAPSRPEL